MSQEHPESFIVTTSPDGSAKSDYLCIDNNPGITDSPTLNKTVQFGTAIDINGLKGSYDADRSISITTWLGNTPDSGSGTTNIFQGSVALGYDQANSKITARSMLDTENGSPTYYTRDYPETTRVLFIGFKIIREAAGDALSLECMVSPSPDFKGYKHTMAYSGSRTKEIQRCYVGLDVGDHDEGQYIVIDQPQYFGRVSSTTLGDVTSWTPYGWDHDSYNVIDPSFTESSWLQRTTNSTGGGAGNLRINEPLLRIYSNLGIPDAGNTIFSRVKWLVEAIGEYGETTLAARLVNIWNQIVSGTYGLSALKTLIDNITNIVEGVEMLLDLTSSGNVLETVMEWLSLECTVNQTTGEYSKPALIPTWLWNVRRNTHYQIYHDFHPPKTNETLKDLLEGNQQ